MNRGPPNMNQGTILIMHFPASAVMSIYFSAPTVSAKNMRHRPRMRRSSAVHVELLRFTLSLYLPF